MKKNIIIIILILFVGIYFTSHAEAAKVNGQEFNDELKIEGTEFSFKGAGLDSYFFIKVFVAGFYVEKNSSAQDFLDDVPKRIEVAYFYKIPGKKLAVETRRRMMLNTNPKEFNQIKDRVNLMNSYFVDLNPGDRYALTYVPKKGTYFTYNEKLIGKIEGQDFAKALFAVWIGKEPISKSLKESLLGNE